MTLLEYYDSLDEHQHKAAIGSDDNLLVEAAPGAGKTRTLIAKALIEADVRPVYVMTFTTSAAEEISQRVKTLLERDEHGEVTNGNIMHIGTLHSWCLGFMRACGSVRELIDDQGLATVAEEVNTRLRLKLPQKRMEELMADATVTSYNERQFNAAFHKMMAENRLMSYDMVLRECALLLQMSPPNWRTSPAVLIDEVQDSSPDDLAIYDAFEAAGADLWLVGDLQQAIYSFRHPHPANVWLWWGKRSVAELATNFRSSKAIVKALNAINATFKPRVDIKPVDDAPDGEVTLLSTKSEAELLMQIGDRIMGLIFQNRPVAVAVQLETFAVLCRTNRECELVSLVLKGHGLGVREKKPELPDKVPGTLWAALGVLRQPQSDWMAKRYLQAIGADPEASQRIATRAMKPIIQTLYPALWAIERMPQEWQRWMDIMLVPKKEQGWFLERMPGDWTDYGWDEILMRLFEAPREPERGSGITVTTVHAAKGREWRHVLMPFCDQQSYRPKNGVEEERVFFVGASRAIETLTFLYSQLRIDEWKGGEIAVAQCAPLERIVEKAKTLKPKRSRRKNEKRS
jgi:DNA helicase-2/ATP-dependent DNA helicase PcrA